MKQFLTSLGITLFLTCFSAGAQQKTISRIEQMPNIPSGYLLRDWKQVTVDYDNFVFDTQKNGTHLPLSRINSANGVNFPAINNIRMDTYVGQSNHGNVAEAINIIPAIVGASLVEVDKTAHLSTDWVSKVKDFFNSKNGQNVYLNNYSAGTGNDWWYEIMPNVFFYQLLSLYPGVDAEFDEQLITVADRQLEVLFKLGGSLNPWQHPNMNYRAFNLITGLPNSTSVPEPESAGSIAWLLYQAYIATNDAKYREGAELALSFLQNWNSNPSYEIQLPYGIAAAAYMNAVEGTNFDLEKMMNWTFSSGIGTLRGWGTIVGNWNGYEMSGLIGEANDRGNDYAFSMNGFQHAAALAPVVKYDKQYARAIGKWMLNLANASRYFYWNGLPQANQQSASYNWAQQYDANACIPYESIKETWSGTRPFAMGDAFRNGWASTDLSLYSGSSVGYMASIIDETNVSGILQIDLNKTDFRGKNHYPVYLYYNPYTESKNVTIDLGSGQYDIYDAITETVLHTNVTGTKQFSIDADNVRLLVVYPANSTLINTGRYLSVEGGGVVDYHHNYNYSNALRVRTFSSNKDNVASGNSVTLNCQATNNSGTVNYEWYINDQSIGQGTAETYNWTPIATGEYTIKCKATDSNTSVWSHELTITVVAAGTEVPQINRVILPEASPFQLGEQLNMAADINTAVDEVLWTSSAGTLQNETTLNPAWILPAQPGIYTLTLTISNGLGQASETIQVLVKDINAENNYQPLIYYPFSGNTQNQAQDAFHAVSAGATLTTDAFGQANSAYNFANSSQYIYTVNQPALNFTSQASIAFAVKPSILASYEQFILSHGSWEERYKISITPEKYVRWTLKTDNSVVDVDDVSELNTNYFTHYIAQYTGYSLELYKNGKLVAFKEQTGNIATSSKNLTLARKDAATTEYNFRGVIDEVYIFDKALSPKEINELSLGSIGSGLTENVINQQILYPNPFKDFFVINLPDGETAESLQIMDLNGRILYAQNTPSNVIYPSVANKGIYIVKITGISGKIYISKLVKS